VRVHIDWDLCAGAGLCVAAAPAAFALVEAGPGRHRAVLVAPADAATLWTAAYACPSLAIHLDDDEGRPVYPPLSATGAA